MRRLVALAASVALVGCAAEKAAAPQPGAKYLETIQGRIMRDWAGAPGNHGRVLVIGRIAECQMRGGESRIRLDPERWVVGSPQKKPEDRIVLVFPFDEWKDREPAPGERWLFAARWEGNGIHRVYPDRTGRSMAAAIE